MLYTGLHGFSSLVADHTAVPRDLHKCIIVTSCLFYICSSVHRNSTLKKSNKMQQYADIYLLQNVSGVHRTHHQQYIKL